MVTYATATSPDGFKKVEFRAGKHAVILTEDRKQSKLTLIRNGKYEDRVLGAPGSANVLERFNHYVARLKDWDRRDMEPEQMSFRCPVCCSVNDWQGPCSAECNWAWNACADDLNDAAHGAF